MELDQLKLRLFHPDGKTFDVVKAAKGDYYPKDGLLTSQSDVEVQLAAEGCGLRWNPCPLNS